MFQSIRIICVYLTLLLIVICYSCKSKQGQNETSTKSPSWSNKEIIATIKDRVNLTKVNDQPQPLMPAVNELCVLPSQIALNDSNKNPHNNHLINVYVNEIGEHNMTKIKNPSFPVGSVLIKEKFSLSQDSVTPKKVELFTVMIKRKKGYNPECGDWEFAAISGNFEEIERGKIRSCIKCHALYDQSDFVFRKNYLSVQFKKQLH